MTHEEKAGKLFLEGYNCAQSVAGAFQEELGMERSDIMKMASSFGAGMGRMREVCGAVSGMFLVTGLLYGYDDPKDLTAKKEHYERVQLLAGRFKDRTGSIICRELLGAEGKDSSPTPKERTDSYYHKRPCVKMVELAAAVLEEYCREG